MGPSKFRSGIRLLPSEPKGWPACSAKQLNEVIADCSFARGNRPGGQICNLSSASGNPSDPSVSHLPTTRIFHYNNFRPGAGRCLTLPAAERMLVWNGSCRLGKRAKLRTLALTVFDE